MAIQCFPVDRVASISKDDFLRQYKKSAKPLVIEDLTQNWPAREKWSVDYFKSTVGDTMVPLYDSERSTDKKHQHAAAVTMPFKEYISLLQAGEKNLRMFFFNLLAATPVLRKDFEFPDIGLKLFKKLPVLFMAGKGARVQMHFDIDMADILLCHFGGKKRVTLVSPEQTRYLYRVPFSFSSLFDIDYDKPNFEKYPALKNIRAEVVELNHGDVLYIPPGYWHYVQYDEISFSMSLRAFPRQPRTLARMLYNLLMIRPIEGLMRRLVGQPWNDRNERRAISKTHRRLGIT
ncbi:cupin-like domain-containing protein [Thiomicrorhabdus arctica]|uniref:cupin-like domain-containing protein n=1 Tax=Thiomicrorhabdus arctica TaxID=131540 RepID=UPI000360FB57|nr:cupin-like domain-containing protein [Thiomicrorhabdus arctica]